MFAKKVLDIYTELLDFVENYKKLQDRMEFALDISRSSMPVIEPKDMSLFKRKNLINYSLNRAIGKSCS